MIHNDILLTFLITQRESLIKLTSPLFSEDQHIALHFLRAFICHSSPMHSNSHRTHINASSLEILGSLVKIFFSHGSNYLLQHLQAQAVFSWGLLCWIHHLLRDACHSETSSDLIPTSQIIHPPIDYFAAWEYAATSCWYGWYCSV